MRAEKSALPLSVSGEKLAARFTHALFYFRKVWNGHRAMVRLNDLSDHELLDIGLTRESLQRVHARPLFADPTEDLQALRLARNHAPARCRKRA